MQKEVDVQPSNHAADAAGVRRTTQQQIIDLVPYLRELQPAQRALVERLFLIQEATGRLRPPESMHGWINRNFGDLEAVREQPIVRVTNRWTLEGTLFNPLRARRPVQGSHSTDVAQVVADTAGEHDVSGFCKPESGTPADIFGRVRGRYCLTAGNIAKYDGLHGVLIFKEHNPLLLSRELIADYLETAQSWFQAAHASEPEAHYPFLLWNCLWKSGASVIHGHAQMSLARGMAYPKIEQLRRTVELYRQQHQAGYFDDLYAAHQALGLAVGSNPELRVFPSLAPIKEKEVLILAQPGATLAEALFQVLDCFITELGVQSFNVALVYPPLAKTSERWDEMPLLARIVDRGDPLNRASDWGAMELYAASVVSSDPYEVARALAGRFR